MQHLSADELSGVPAPFRETTVVANNSEIYGSSMKHCRSAILPVSCPPRGLSRAGSAAYVGVSPSLFDEMVKDGRMPQPKLINSRTVWDRHELDGAFEALPSKENLPLAPVNEWDGMK